MPILNTAAKQKPAAAWQDAEDMYFSPDTAVGEPYAAWNVEQRSKPAASLGLTPYGTEPGSAPWWRKPETSNAVAPVSSGKFTAPVVPFTPHTTNLYGPLSAGQSLPPTEGAAALLERDRDAMRAQADAVMAGYAKKKKFPGIK